MSVLITKPHMDSVFIASCIIVVRDAVYSITLQSICMTGLNN